MSTFPDWRPPLVNDSLNNLIRGLRKTYKGTIWKLGLWTLIAVTAESVVVDLASEFFQLSAIGEVRQQILLAPRFLGVQSPVNTVGPLLLKIGSLAIFCLAFRVWVCQRRFRQTERISGSISKELRTRLFRESHRTSGTLITPESAQQTIQLIQNDSVHYGRLVASQLSDSMLAMARIFTGFCMIAMIRWDWALILASGSILIWAVNRQSQKSNLERANATAIESERLRKSFQEEIREAYQSRSIGSEIGNSRPSDLWISRWSDWDQSASASVFSIHQTGNWAKLLIISLMIFSISLRTASEPVSPESMMALLCLGCSGLVLFNLSRKQNQKSDDATATIESVYHALSSSVRLWDLSDAVAMQPCRSSVRIEDLPLGLGPEDPRSQILLSANVPARKVTAIVCPDVSQRRKLMRMIARWEDPSSGRVLVDGVDLRSCTNASTRLQIGTIRSDSYVNNGTILQNITLNDPRGDLLNAIEAAKEVHAHRMIQRMPEGYQTEIDLSKSPEESVYSRFLIALARGKWHDPSILLVEEPSPGMTRSMRELLRDSYRRLARDRTVLLFTRHAATVLAADYVILISSKKVVQGSPKNLIKSHAGFRRAMVQMGLGLKQKNRLKPKSPGTVDSNETDQT